MRPIDHDEMRRRASAIALVISDCDGVLTDGGVYYSERGEELKRFSIRDGMGFERLRDAGMACAVITGEHSGSVQRRADKLKARAYLGARDKAALLPLVLRDHRLIDASQLAYIGDDVNDLALLTQVAALGLTGAPSDAMQEVVAAAHFVSLAPAGRGAFRQFAEWIIGLRQRPPASAGG